MSSFVYVAALLYLATLGESGVLMNQTDSDSNAAQNAEILQIPEVDVPNAICPPDAELVAGICKCREDLCKKPHCDKFLNLVIDVVDSPEICCPTYTCDDCIDKFLVDGKCVCPENATINSKGVCECIDRYESIENDTCQCDLNKCPLPNLCDEHSVGIPQIIGCCTFIDCKLCPEGSYPKRYNSDLIDDKCVCDVCPETSCETGYVPRYIERGRNIPGSCCDVYQCIPTNTVSEKSCYINYTLYHHLESWLEDECRNCTCYNGEPVCTSENTLAHCHSTPTNTMSEESCIVNDTLFRHMESWSEDECTNCTCNNGKPKCVSHFCHTKVSIITPECPEINCKKFCKYGYKLNRKGCQICKCKLPEINKEMDYFMRNHNLTEEDVLVILRMYIENKNIFREPTSTTTILPNEIHKMSPKYELLEIFMLNHNLTERDVLEMLEIQLQNADEEATTEIRHNIPSISSMPHDLSPTDNTRLWIALIAVFVVGLVIGWTLHLCKRYFFPCEERHENNNTIDKKSSRTPIEQIKHNHEKKPLTTT